MVVGEEVMDEDELVLLPLRTEEIVHSRPSQVEEEEEVAD